MFGWSSSFIGIGVIVHFAILTVKTDKIPLLSIGLFFLIRTKNSSFALLANGSPSVLISTVFEVSSGWKPTIVFVIK